MKTSYKILGLFCLLFSYSSKGQSTEWLMSDLFLNATEQDVYKSGNPKIVSSPYGDAVNFNGENDAFFLDENPLETLESFTVEMVFKPVSHSNFEQRILHIGEVSNDRMLLEIRTVNSNWYFDGFAASKDNKLALINEEFLHPLDIWYHVAFVVTPNSLTTFVNGKQELQESFNFKPILSGSTSIGVRLNKRSYFKGAIYKIRVSPNKLDPESFMTF